LIIPARRGLLGRAWVPPAMWVPLIALGAAAIAMPNALFGVWGVDYRLPVVFVFLLIAACSWRDVPPQVEALLACGLVAMLAVNMAEIASVWRPIGRQFDEFRAALAVIPPGARVIAFRDQDGIDPALSREPAALYDHLPTLAIIERDAYVPFLFKHKMMPVEAAPGLRAIDTSIGKPVDLADFVAGANPARGSSGLGTLRNAGVHDYWQDWPHHYDYAIELGFGAHPTLPAALTQVSAGEFFTIYRIH
jgi:hypothetical protein